MSSISQRKDGEKHLFYYELLLLYRSFNPEIDVELVDKKEYKSTANELNFISFVEPVVKKYSKKNNTTFNRWFNYRKM